MAREKLFALDISYVNLKAVRGKLKYFGIGENVYLVVGDALSTPFKNNRFDVAESWFGLGNIIGFKKVVEQAYRVVRHGGYFTVSGAWSEAYFDPKHSVYGKVIKEFTVQEHEKLIEFLRRNELLLHVNEVIEIFRKSGFRDIGVFERNGLYVVTGKKT